MFPSPKIDLSVEVQTASRAPFVFVFSDIHQRKGTYERRDSGRESDIDARRRIWSTDRNKNYKIVFLIFLKIISYHFLISVYSFYMFYA